MGSLFLLLPPERLVYSHVPRCSALNEPFKNKQFQLKFNLQDNLVTGSHFPDPSCTQGNAKRNSRAVWQTPCSRQDPDFPGWVLVCLSWHPKWLSEFRNEFPLNFLTPKVLLLPLWPQVGKYSQSVASKGFLMRVCSFCRILPRFLEGWGHHGSPVE